MSERNFCRTCGHCGQRAMALETVAYTTSVHHDGRDYTVTIPSLVIPKCSNCGSISIDLVAEQKISEAFHREALLLLPSEITEKREALALSQQTLADQLGISVSSLSRWESGVQLQPRCMDKILRAYFDLYPLRTYYAQSGSSQTVSPVVGGS